jgi:hypothetical protein
MARTNYKQGKRLRELARAQKQADKAKRREERKAAALAGGVEGGAPILDGDGEGEGAADEGEVAQGGELDPGSPQAASTSPAD